MTPKTPAQEFQSLATRFRDLVVEAFGWGERVAQEGGTGRADRIVELIVDARDITEQMRNLMNAEATKRTAGQPAQPETKS